MCDEDQIDYNEYGVARAPIRYSRKRDEGPTHKQKPAFINGHFVEVDEGIHDLILDLNSMGLTTRFSCQGLNAEEAAKDDPDEDTRGYIMFEGTSAWLVLLRHLDNLDKLTEQQEMILQNMHLAEQLRDHWGEGGPYESVRKVTIIPPGEESSWTVEHDAPRSRIGQRHFVPVAGDNFDRVTIRIPTWDLEEFTKMIKKLAKSRPSFV